MVASSSHAVLKRWIGLELSRLRTAAGKTRPEAAARTGLSKTTIGHMETGRNFPAATALEVLLGFYGVPERLPFFLDLVAVGRKGHNWWNQLAGAAPSWVELFLGLEAGAAELSSFDGYLVPGLLQTSEYAEAVMRADPDLTEDEIRRRVELRMGRQQILDRVDDPALLWVIIDESVLHRRRGTPEVMAAQLEHLLAMSQRPRIDLQVLPLTAGAHVAQEGTFQILKFPTDLVGDPGIVYVECLIEGRYYETPTQVAVYERAMARLRVQAATQAESRVILQRAAREVVT